MKQISKFMILVAATTLGGLNSCSGTVGGHANRPRVELRLVAEQNPTPLNRKVMITHTGGKDRDYKKFSQGFEAAFFAVNDIRGLEPGWGIDLGFSRSPATVIITVSNPGLGRELNRLEVIIHPGTNPKKLGEGLGYDFQAYLLRLQNGPSISSLARASPPGRHPYKGCAAGGVLL